MVVFQSYAHTTMAPSTSTTAAQPGPSGQAAAAAPEIKDHFNTLEDLMNFLVTEKEQAAKSNALKHFANKDTRDELLSGQLSTGEDPLDVLTFEDNTLGCLYILLSSYFFSSLWFAHLFLLWCLDLRGCTRPVHHRPKPTN